MNQVDRSAERLSSTYFRWLFSNVATVAPQSMAPIVFGIATLHYTSDVNLGAAMVVAMTIAQVAGASPITALGGRFNINGFLRVIIGLRALMFTALGVAVFATGPAAVLIGLAALAGLANGAILGLLRAVLNGIAAESRLPRALGLVAIGNEAVFVTGPVAASILASWSLPAALATMVLASALPLVTLPALVPLAKPDSTERASRLSVGFLVVLLCAVAGSATVGAVEVGAVLLAVDNGLSAGWALAFTVPLCIASVAGGIVVSVRNRRPGQQLIVVMLASTAAGAVLLATMDPLWLLLGATVLIGFWLPPLSTALSMELEDVLPAARRAHGFAALRSAQAVGVISSGTLLAVLGVDAAFVGATVITLLAIVGVIVKSVIGPSAKSAVTGKPKRNKGDEQ